MRFSSLLLSFSTLLVLPAVQSTTVYLSPTQDQLSSNKLSVQHASNVIAQHLGLEMYETLLDEDDYFSREQTFVGQGEQRGLLLSIDEHDIKRILPTSLKSAFSIPNNRLSSLDSLITSYTARASHVYTSIVSDSPRSASATLDAFGTLPPSYELENFYSQLSTLSNLLDSEDASSFAALELTSLTLLRASFGPSSPQYTLATSAVHAAIESAVAQSKSLRLVVLTISPMIKREEEPQTSLVPETTFSSSFSSCFASVDACANATSSCSGRGQCVQDARRSECFSCACKLTSTQDGKKTHRWVGERCEREDVSGPFVLLAGTVIVLLLFGFGSVKLLWAIGNEDLPSTLLSTAVGGAGNKRD